MATQASSTTMFGQWLRQRRRSLDLTQTALAQRVNCSVVTIRKIEAGERRPSQHLALLLADLVGISGEELATFVVFARTDVHAESFRHPLFTPSTVAQHHAIDLLAPDEAFATDAPGWIHATSGMPVPLSNTLLTLRVVSAPTDSPRSDVLSDGRMLCKIYAQGHVSGQLTGTVTQDVTHLVKDPSQRHAPCTLATFLTIETDAGTVRGYCTGFSIRSDDNRFDHIRMHGQIISVTPNYSDLFLASLFYEGGITYPGALETFAVTERGILSIHPR